MTTLKEKLTWYVVDSEEKYTISYKLIFVQTESISQRLMYLTRDLLERDVSFAFGIASEASSWNHAFETLMLSVNDSYREEFSAFWSAVSLKTGIQFTLEAEQPIPEDNLQAEDNNETVTEATIGPLLEQEAGDINEAEKAKEFELIEQIENSVLEDTTAEVDSRHVQADLSVDVDIQATDTLDSQNGTGYDADISQTQTVGDATDNAHERIRRGIKRELQDDSVSTRQLRPRASQGLLTPPNRPVKRPRRQSGEAHSQSDNDLKWNLQVRQDSSFYLAREVEDENEEEEVIYVSTSSPSTQSASQSETPVPPRRIARRHRALQPTSSGRFEVEVVIPTPSRRRVRRSRKSTLKRSKSSTPTFIAANERVPGKVHLVFVATGDAASAAIPQIVQTLRAVSISEKSEAGDIHLTNIT